MPAITLQQELKTEFGRALQALTDEGILPHEHPKVSLTPPKQASHGDFACNIALALAKPAKKNPRELAEAIKAKLGDAGGLVEKVEIAGPGFLNLFISASTWHRVLTEIITEGADYLKSNAGEQKKYLLEYVSANPTGPLHIAHGRGAVIGDILARLMKTAGYDVTREYYVNDLGNQVDVLARSVYIRYQELHGRTVEHPEAFYPADYVLDLAEGLKKADGDKHLDQPEETWLEHFKDQGVALMLERIKSDLKEFGVEFDHFTSEKELTERVGLDSTLQALESGGYIYEDDEGKKWFRTTDFGDDKDRVVVREDGRTTYFASDIAYHHEKLRRGHDKLINIWGADHLGYRTRVEAGIEALGYADKPLEVIFIQMVSLLRGGKKVRMGKRLGTAIWLKEVLDEAGRDATRYFFALRRCEAQMEFDIDLATKKSLDNPVYYAQMGHARLCSIQRKAMAESVPEPQLGPGVFEVLTLPEEIGLVCTMSRAPEVIANAALEREPHQVVHYIQDLITQFHSYFGQYKKTERVVSDDPEKTRARLLMCRGLQQILRSLLVDILGVSAPEEMYLERTEDDAEASEG